MVTTESVETLESLLAFLDTLQRRASVEELQDRLGRLQIAFDDIASYVHFDDKRYLRNLIRETKWYHALALCWRSGQRSPIHNHAGSTCGLRVVKGTATETKFEMSPCSQVRAVCSNDQAVGSVSVSQDADIHQVSNLRAKGDDLVTLHIYSPPLYRMDMYSITDGRVSEFRPMVLEHVHCSGI